MYASVLRGYHITEGVTMTVKQAITPGEGGGPVYVSGSDKGRAGGVVAASQTPLHHAASMPAHRPAPTGWKRLDSSGELGRMMLFQNIVPWKPPASQEQTVVNGSPQYRQVVGHWVHYMDARLGGTEQRPPPPSLGHGGALQQLITGLTWTVRRIQAAKKTGCMMHCPFLLSAEKALP